VEITDHGQSLTLRTRRGADFVLGLAMIDSVTTDPIDLTGATVVSRIFAQGQAGFVFDYSIGGVDNNVITVTLTAARTLSMTQDWEYVLGYKLAGITKALLFGPLYVSQEQL